MNAAIGTSQSRGHRQRCNQRVPPIITRTEWPTTVVLTTVVVVPPSQMSETLHVKITGKKKRKQGKTHVLLPIDSIYSACMPGCSDKGVHDLTATAHGRSRHTGIKRHTLEQRRVEAPPPARRIRKHGTTHNYLPRITTAP